MSFILGLLIGLGLGWFFLPQPEPVRALLLKTPLARFMR